MMSMHAGMERTRSQWTRLLEHEGLRVVEFWLPPERDGEGIIEVELAGERKQFNGLEYTLEKYSTIKYRQHKARSMYTSNVSLECSKQ